MEKPIYKKWWFWMLIVLTLLANIVSAGYGMRDVMENAVGALCLPLCPV